MVPSTVERVGHFTADEVKAWNGEQPERNVRLMAGLAAGRSRPAA
jgi:hypothetical protein